MNIGQQAVRCKGRSSSSCACHDEDQVAPPRKIVIGEEERFLVPAGESSNVRVHLSRNGRRRVLRERNVRCSASAVTRAPDGDTKTTRRSITLVAPRTGRRGEARK